MNQPDSIISNDQRSKNATSNLDIKLTKRGKALLKTLYTLPPIMHKDLAKTLDMRSNALTNLIQKVNTDYKGFIISESKGQRKYYSLSEIAKTYTEKVLLPEETERKNAITSFQYNDSLINNVIDSLKKFKEIEGGNWDIVLDNLLFVDTGTIPASNSDSKEESDQKWIIFKDETHQNYIDLKNALITLITQHGKESVKQIYDILNQNILRKRLDALLSNTLDDFFKMEPLFRLEKKDLQTAYSIIDKIFTECFPKVFGSNPASYPNPLPPEYSIHPVIIKMANEFEDNYGDKAVAIALWEKKFHTRNHFSCISYIAEKCNTIYMRQQKSVPPI